MIVDILRIRTANEDRVTARSSSPDPLFRAVVESDLD